MKTGVFVGVLVVAGSLTAAAQASDVVRVAMLTEVSGKVLVNSGKGYLSAKAGTALNSGDRVISLDGSHAAVVFADGCKTELPENSLIAVESKAQCGKAATRTGAGSAASGIQSARGERILLAQAIGSQNDAGGKKDDPAGKKEDDDRRLGLWIWGGVAGVGALLVANGKSNDRPVSNH